MNRGNIRTEIRLMIKDTATDASRRRWSDTDLNNRINWEQERVVGLTKCLVKRGTASNITAGTAEYSLPTDFLTEIGVQFLDSDGQWYPLTKITEAELDLMDVAWRQTSGTPGYYYLRGASIGLYPNPDTTRASALRIDYSYKATDMTADADIPFASLTALYPYHDILSDGVSRKCKLDEGDLTGASVLNAEFTRKLREIKYQLGMQAEGTRIVNIYETVRQNSRRTR